MHKIELLDSERLDVIYFIQQKSSKLAMKQALTKASTGGTCQIIHSWKHRWSRQSIGILQKQL